VTQKTTPAVREKHEQRRHCLFGLFLRTISPKFDCPPPPPRPSTVSPLASPSNLFPTLALIYPPLLSPSNFYLNSHDLSNLFPTLLLIIWVSEYPLYQFLSCLSSRLSFRWSCPDPNEVKDFNNIHKVAMMDTGIRLARLVCAFLGTVVPGHYRTIVLPYRKTICLRTLLWKQCSYILHKSTSCAHIDSFLRHMWSEGRSSESSWLGWAVDFCEGSRDQKSFLLFFHRLFLFFCLPSCPPLSSFCTTFTSVSPLCSTCPPCTSVFNCVCAPYPLHHPRPCPPVGTPKKLALPCSFSFLLTVADTRQQTFVPS
jgi:hypothetical protein